MGAYDPARHRDPEDRLHPPKAYTATERPHGKQVITQITVVLQWYRYHGLLTQKGRLEVMTLKLRRESPVRLGLRTVTGRGAQAKETTAGGRGPGASKEVLKSGNVGEKTVTCSFSFISY